MKRQHIRIPYYLLDLDIATGAKTVYLALLCYRSGTSKRINVKLKTIAVRADLKERQVKRHIQTLCTHNILSRKQKIHGNGAWGCNHYEILCDEKYYAAIPYDIVYNRKLSALELITYCILKRYTNLEKQDYICWIDRTQLAKRVGCSVNHIDKIKRKLKQAGYIEYKRGDIQITLIYEQQ